MTEFAYNNAKNISICHTLFELNCAYYLKILFKENINLHLQFYSTNKLARELKKHIKICCQNLFYV